MSEGLCPANDEDGGNQSVTNYCDDHQRPYSFLCLHHQEGEEEALNNNGT